MPIHLCDLSKAIVEALWLCARTPYSFPDAKKEELNENWFTGFANRWNVARTIKPNTKHKVIEILNSKIVKNINEISPSDIDDVALLLHQEKLSTTGKPLSLVSKIAFTYNPEKFPPLDSRAKSGLKKRQRKKGERGSINTYANFFTTWNSHYLNEKTNICETLSDNRWIEITKEMGINCNELNPTTLEKSSFHRKIFDNVLLNEGGDNSWWKEF
ncbi:hypothetical protein [Kiloniella sp.]|uniref:hypothetical protein n=1 Tax=Kiloniella sp. TaxID=1938587 RepID=UPI003B0185A2